MIRRITGASPRADGVEFIKPRAGLPPRQVAPHVARTRAGVYLVRPMNEELSHPPAGGPPVRVASADTAPAAKSVRGDAMVVLKRLRDAGHEAYFAGGCVRDLLLARAPRDWDVATNAPPNRVRGLFSNTQAVGAAFGVILVRYGGSQIEVATFRADAQYLDGRHPTGVRFTTAGEDARRRDFTINGLFLDPLLDAPLQEQVIDFVGGRDDLRNHVIRAIGDPEARFREDHLRLLRAVRFAARFGFTIEPQTAAAIRRHAAQLIRISPERIADELRTMLTPPTRNEAYRLLEELSLRPLLFRFLEMPDGKGRAPRADSIFAALAPGEWIPFGLALAGAGIDHYLRQGPDNVDVRRLFERPIAQRIVHALRQSLKISNEESEELGQSLEGLDLLTRDDPPTLAIKKRFLARAAAPLSRELLDALGETGLLASKRVEALRLQLAELEKTEFAPPPLITGDDLTTAGLVPGPMFKRVLDRVYDEQLEDRIRSREEAMTLALRLAGERA
ncbi:MAG TPA: CCA tRNA nucleotidyltransferase [Tepidisphaeraceae bacterium]|nr:CCA tRNA nucleotidyltransferase [Tepidisphaeraceae bacterium]